MSDLNTVDITLFALEERTESLPNSTFISVYVSHKFHMKMPCATPPVMLPWAVVYVTSGLTGVHRTACQQNPQHHPTAPSTQDPAWLFRPAFFLLSLAQGCGHNALNRLFCYKRTDEISAILLSSRIAVITKP